jgi:hypothetical protein
MTIYYNQLTKEPYLRLPAPRSNIIITPHRLENLDEDAVRLAEILNHPRVYPWLERTPYPYLYDHGVEWIKAHCKENEEILSTLRKNLEQGGGFNTKGAVGLVSFDRCPFTCIREVQAEETGTGTPLNDRLIGDLKLARYTFYEHLHNNAERSKAQLRIENLPAGDERIVWTLGGN